MTRPFVKAMNLRKLAPALGLLLVVLVAPALHYLTAVGAI